MFIAYIICPDQSKQFIQPVCYVERKQQQNIKPEEKVQHRRVLGVNFFVFLNDFVALLFAYFTYMEVQYGGYNSPFITVSSIQESFLEYER